MRLVRVFFGIRLFQVYNRTRFFSLQEVITVSRVITEFESKVERDIKRFKSDLYLTTEAVTPYGVTGDCINELCASR